MKKTRLTKTALADASPGQSEYTIWDLALPGFGLRVRPSGSKTFVFVYRTEGGRKGKTQRVTLKAKNPEVARTAAKALAAQYHGGGDPAAVKAEGRRGDRHGAAGPFSG